MFRTSKELFSAVQDESDRQSGERIHGTDHGDCLTVRNRTSTPVS